MSNGRKHTTFPKNLAYTEDQDITFLLLGLSVQTLGNLTEFNRKMELSYTVE